MMEILIASTEDVAASFRQLRIGIRIISPAWLIACFWFCLPAGVVQAGEFECPLDTIAPSAEYHPEIVETNFFDLVSDLSSQDNETEIRRLINQCLIPAGKIKSILNQQYFWVDVRGKDDFERKNFPGSINIRLSEIDKKPFLRKKPILLFANSYLDFDLIYKCGYLKNTGFEQVYVLEGGIENLLMLNNPVSDFDENKLLTPKQIMALEDKLNWFVVAVTRFEDYAQGKANIFHFPAGSSDTVIANRISELLVQHRHRFGYYSRILVTFDHNYQFERIENLLGSEFRPYVYYLREGIQGYSDFVIELDALLRQKDLMKNRMFAQCGFQK